MERSKLPCPQPDAGCRIRGRMQVNTHTDNYRTRLLPCPDAVSGCRSRVLVNVALVRRGHFLIHVGWFQLAVFHLHAISIVRSVRLLAGQLVAPPLPPVDRQEPIPADVKRGPVKLVTMQEMSLPNQDGSLNRG